MRRLVVGLLQQPPGIGDGRPTETSDFAEQWVADLERLGARIVEARVPGATANTRPQFLHEAKKSHAATFPKRADEYSDVMREKLEAAQKADPGEVAAARAGAKTRNFQISFLFSFLTETLCLTRF